MQCPRECITTEPTTSHRAHRSSSKSLAISPPVVYSVSYWDSSSSGFLLRLLPLEADGLRMGSVWSEGLELTSPDGDVE